MIRAYQAAPRVMLFCDAWGLSRAVVDSLGDILEITPYAASPGDYGATATQSAIITSAANLGITYRDIWTYVHHAKY